MYKIKFIRDMFVGPVECIEEGAVLNLKEYQNCFEITTDEGYVVCRYANELKEEIYQYFIKEK